MTFSALPSGIELQSTLRNTLCSVLFVERLPLNDVPVAPIDKSVVELDEVFFVEDDDDGEMLSQLALEVAVNVNGTDPPILISTNLLPKGVNGVRVMLGSGQL